LTDVKVKTVQKPTFTSDSAHPYHSHSHEYFIVRRHMWLSS